MDLKNRKRKHLVPVIISTALSYSEKIYDTLAYHFETEEMLAQFETIIQDVNEYADEHDTDSISLDEIIDYIARSLQFFIDYHNQQESCDCKFWIDDIFYIDFCNIKGVFDLMSLPEYQIHPKILTRVYNKIMDGELPKNSLVALFNVDIILNTIPIAVVDPDFYKEK